MLSQVDSTIVNSEKTMLIEMKIVDYSKLELKNCVYKINKPMSQTHLGDTYSHSSWTISLK